MGATRWAPSPTDRPWRNPAANRTDSDHHEPPGRCSTTLRRTGIRRTEVESVGLGLTQSAGRLNRTVARAELPRTDADPMPADPTEPDLARVGWIQIDRRGPPSETGPSPRRRLRLSHCSPVQHKGS